MVPTAAPFRLARMLLTQPREPFDGADWLFEPKWALHRRRAGGSGPAAQSERNDLTARFPSVPMRSGSYRTGR
jgi:hypothetical protein